MVAVSRIRAGGLFGAVGRVTTFRIQRPKPTVIRTALVIHSTTYNKHTQHNRRLNFILSTQFDRRTQRLDKCNVCPFVGCRITQTVVRVFSINLGHRSKKTLEKKIKPLKREKRDNFLNIKTFFVSMIWGIGLR